MFKRYLIITILILILSGGILIYASFLDKEEPVKPVNNTFSNDILEPDDNDQDNQDQANDVDDNDISEIDTSDWKVYTNEEFGFEIKYPQDYKAIEELDRAQVIITPDSVNVKDPDPFYAPIAIVTRNNNERLSIEKWFQKNYPKDDISKLQKVEFNRIDGMRFSKWSNSIGSFYFSNEDKIYSISALDLQKNIENQLRITEKMLSTFSFIEFIDGAIWKTYRNEEFGYEIKYPGIYSVEDWSEKIIGDDPSRNPWYTRTDFLLSFVIFENPTSKCRTGFAFQILNTTDKDKIKSAGGWEFIKENGIKKMGNLDVYLYSIDSGTNNMQVIFRSGKTYRFLYYHLLEEDFSQILSTFKFIES